ncbi:hypothetical protein PENTCL1PPCAC_3988, partial [Pristionchus entomophagus]
NSKSQVGPYRYLLLIFAVVDVLISLTHATIIPAIHMTEFGFIGFSYRFLNDTTAAGKWAEPPRQLNVFPISSPPWLAWIRQRPWRNWLILGLIADVTFIGSIEMVCVVGLIPTDVSRSAFAPVLKEFYNIDLFASNKPGYLALTYWV